MMSCGSQLIRGALCCNATAGGGLASIANMIAQCARTSCVPKENQWACLWHMMQQCGSLERDAVCLRRIVVVVLEPITNLPIPLTEPSSVTSEQTERRAGNCNFER